MLREHWIKYWQNQVWKHCVNDSDKEIYGEAARPHPSTVFWYGTGRVAELIIIILVALPGTMSHGLIWVLLTIWLRASTIRSTRIAHTEDMNAIIYEPHHQMQALLFSIPLEIIIAYVIALGLEWLANLY